jgi:hypothetical protein
VKKIIGVLLAIIVTFSAQGQKKFGSIYVTWGYHRDVYTRSNIHFKDTKTDDYNFTLEQAKAKDRLDMHDFFHTPPTVPQYVFNIGYFFANKPSWGIEVSWDHLKYIVTDYQTMHMKGTFRGKYYDLDTLITPQFVHFEHTNGNNYFMVNVVRKFSPLKEGIFKSHLNILVKAGAGGLIPKTDSSIMGNRNDGPFRLSGFVIGASTSLRYDLFHYFYLEGSVKGAFADYTSAKVFEQGRAKHTFFSAQFIWAAGINIPLSK